MLDWKRVDSKLAAVELAAVEELRKRDASGVHAPGELVRARALLDRFLVERSQHEVAER